MTEILVSVFRSVTDTTPIPSSLSWPDDFRRSRPAVAGQKNGPGWSPATFEGMRCKANVRTLTALVLDFDAKHGPHDIDAVSARWSGYEHVVHGTYTPGSYRLILPLSRHVTPAEHAALYAAALLREPSADGATKDPSRFWYWPTHRTDAAGAPLDFLPYFRYVEGALLGPASPTTASSWLTSGGDDEAGDGASSAAPSSHYAGIEHAEQREDVALIESRCAWMAHVRDDAATLAEPEWYAALSILARCRGGDVLAHARSRPYPGYSEAETEAKYRRARGVGPATCAHVRTLSTACRGCTLVVTSPVLLGRPASESTETASGTTSAPLTDTEAVELAREALATAQAVAEAARIAEDRATVALHQASAELGRAKKHASAAELEAATLRHIQAAEARRHAKHVRSGAERDLQKTKARCTAEGVPPGAHAATWQALDVKMGDDGQLKPLDTMRNVSTILSNDPTWSSRLSYDAFALETCIDGVPAADVAWTAVTVRLGRDYRLDTTTARTIECATQTAARREFHPVRDWLRSLSWDGTPRLADLLTHGFGVQLDKVCDAALAAAVARKFMLSLVARVMRPGCQVDTMLVLVGPEGLKKSRTLEAVVGAPWFARTSMDLTNKDSYMNLRGVWLYEFSEMTQLRRTDENSAKSWLSQSSDRYRAPYARRSENHPRQVVLSGTSNEDEFIATESGNRRFWIMYVPAVLDISWVTEHRAQLFAEAVAAFDAGESWWFETDSPEQEKLTRLVDRYRVGHPWLSTVREWFEVNARGLRNGFTASVILSRCLGMQGATAKATDRAQVASVLRRLGCTRRDARGTADGAHETWYMLPADLLEKAAGSPEAEGKKIVRLDDHR